MPTFPLYPGRVTRWKVPGSLTGLMNYSIHPRQDEQPVESGPLLEGDKIRYKTNPCHSGKFHQGTNIHVCNEEIIVTIN